MRLNLAANYAGTAVSALAPVIAFPYYFKYLGAVSWGLVSFAMTLVALFSLIEVGLSQSLQRDLALSTQGDARETTSIFKGFERIYWAMSLGCAAVIALLSGLISTHWLAQSPGEAPASRHAVWFAAAMLALQLPGSIYRMTLLATERHVALNRILCATAVARHLGAIGALQVDPRIETVFAWYVVTAGVDTFWKRWRALSAAHIQTGVAPIHWPMVTRMLKSGLKMSAAVLIGVLASQLDKVMLSHFAPIQELGYYTLALAIAAGVLQLGAPVMTTMAPRFSLAGADPATLKALSQRLVRYFLAGIALVAVVYLFASRAALHVWLRDPELERRIAPVLDLLLIGSALNLLYQVGYQRWIATGRSRNIAWVNFGGICTSVLLTPLLIVRFGGAGAAASWIVTNALGALGSLWFLVGRNDAPKHERQDTPS